MLSAAFYCIGIFFVAAGFLQDLFITLGESFLVALLLAAVGDLYLRKAASQGSIRQGVQAAIQATFGFLGSDVPPSLREAVETFARTEQYYKSTRWELHFTWADEAKSDVLLALKVRNTGVNLGNTDFLPQHPLWVLDSVDGRNSSYLEYGFKCDEVSIDIDLRGDALSRYLRHDEGRLSLDQQQIIHDHVGSGNGVPHHASFSAVRATSMYRNAADSVPLMHTSFETDFELAISGPAVSDLNVSVFHPKSGSGDQEWRIEEHQAGETHRRAWSSVTPGQATLIFWTPVR